MKTAILVLFLCSCSVSTVDIDERAAYVSQAARYSVEKAMQALMDGNEKAFKSLLSKERLSVYTSAYFDAWSTKVKKYKTWSMGQYEPGRELIDGTVTVVLKSGRKGDFVAVRIRFENGKWRWHHR